MHNIKTLAGKVSGKLNEGLTSGGPTFDPSIIIAIITALMQMFAGCKSSARQAKFRATNVANGRGLGHRLDRLRGRCVVENNAPDDQADEIEAALLDSVDETDEQTFADCLADVGQP